MHKCFQCVKIYTFGAMEEKRKQIFVQSAQLFMRLGIRSVNMDDVAGELKMSKKTLYKYVNDKADLVYQVFQHYLNSEECLMEEVQENHENAIDELIAVTKRVSAQLNQIHPSIHFDLAKYYPKAWELMAKHKKEFIYRLTMSNLERGIKQGLYRKDLTPDVIAKLYIEKIDVLFDHTVFPTDQYRFGEVHLEWMRYHIRGIATDEGISYLKQKLKSENINL